MRMVSSDHSTPSSTQLPMHKINSHKFKPKIRIIQIFAPEIINTEVANFRELVQRLTGKATAAETKGMIMKKKRKLPTSRSSFIHHAKPAASLLPTGCGDQVHNIKEDENESSSTGFFDGFTDMDGFIQ